MTSNSSTIKIGGSTLNLLKPLNVYAYVELGNGFSYGLCGVESLSYNVENLKLQYDLSNNIINKTYTNIVHVTVNLTLRRIFPNVPFRDKDGNLTSLNYENRNRRPSGKTTNYFVVSI